ncbi:MAG: membrane protein insertase YidC, partial [Bryobacteraceae bacterium]
MADPDKPQEKKELSMEVRMAIAFGLMLLVLLGSPYFYKLVMPTPPPGAEKKAPANTSQPAAKSPPAAAKPPAPNVAAAATPEPAAPTAAAAEQKETIETDLFKVTFSNRGGVVESWILKKFTVSCTTRPLELVNSEAAPVTGFPLSLWFKTQKPSSDVNQALYTVKRAPDNLGIDFEFSSGKTTVRKKIRFTRNTYLLDLSTEVTEMGAPLPHEITWRGGFGDMAVPSAAASQHTIYYDEAASKLVVYSVSDAKNGPLAESGLYSFAGLEDTYFAAVFLPHPNTTIGIVTLSEAVPSPATKQTEPHIGAAVGGDGRNQLSLFVGPKDIDILRAINPKLEQVVDFGYVGFLAKPLFLVVRWVNDHWVHNYGWSIILVTIFINFALLPLK